MPLRHWTLAIALLAIGYLDSAFAQFRSNELFLPPAASTSTDASPRRRGESAGSDNIGKAYLASEINWSSVFGTCKDEPLISYCLMGQGFFLAPTSNDIEGTIETWLKKHPKAKVIPVYTIRGIRRNKPNAMLAYVWVEDEQACLNIELVRQGCCSADTMESPVLPIMVTKIRYERFINKLREAEARAKHERLGIWESEEGDEKQRK